MSDLVKMIQEANRNERPHPLTTVHGPRAVQPIYAISRHELSELTARIEALETALREALRGLDMVHDGLMDPTRPRQSVGEVCAHWIKATRAALKQA